MERLAKLYPEGWVMYCGTCRKYQKQSDPQNDSRRKTVIIDDEPCDECKRKAGEEKTNA